MCRTYLLYNYVLYIHFLVDIAMYLFFFTNTMVSYVFFFFNEPATTEIYTADTLFPYTTLFRSRQGSLPRCDPLLHRGSGIGAGGAGDRLLHLAGRHRHLQVGRGAARDGAGGAARSTPRGDGLALPGAGAQARQGQRAGPRGLHGSRPGRAARRLAGGVRRHHDGELLPSVQPRRLAVMKLTMLGCGGSGDRKCTRMNSSH